MTNPNCCISHRIQRVVRQELEQRYANKDEQAQAMSAQVMIELNVWAQEDDD